MENNKRENRKPNADKSHYNSFRTFFVKNYKNTIRCKEKHKKEEEKSTEIKESDTKIKLSEKVGVIFTIILSVATVLLAYYTYQLFRETQNTRIDNKKAIEAAITSAKNSNSAIEEQRRNDNMSEKRQELVYYLDSVNTNKKYKADSVSNQRNFEISVNTLKAQSNALIQQQRDFEIENRPFMVFTNIILDTTFKDNVINITYAGYNVGKFPAKISYMASKINYGIDTSMANTFKVNNWVIRPSKEYLANNGYLNGHNTLQSNKEEIRFFKNEVTHIFIYFDIRYFSSVLKETYSSYTVFQITMKNKNIDVSAIENK